jgi:hypothetical protein
VDVLDSDSGGVSRRPGARWRGAVVALVAVGVVVGSTVFVSTRKSHHAAGTFSIEALAATTRRESVRIVGTDTLSSYGTVKEPSLVETGLIDFHTGDGRLDVATRNGSDGPAKRFETVLSVDGHFYISIDASMLGVPSRIVRTKRWIEPKRSAGFSGALNPFDPLALFTSQHVKFDNLGMTRLGDQEVHHYSGVLHPRYTSPSSSGPPVSVTATVDLYVDSHNRLVRLHEVLRQPGAGASVSQADFADYGVAVHVTAPPADQVYVAPK